MKLQQHTIAGGWTPRISVLAAVALLFLHNTSRADEPPPLHEGIPVIWWETYFGPDYASDPAATALADPDGDSAINFLEFETDTDPTDEASFERHPASVSTFAGSEQGWQDGPRTEALLNNPRDLAYDPQGRLWFTETTHLANEPTSHRIRVIDDQDVVSTLSGSAEPGLVNGPLEEARFNTPQTPVFDSQGNAYIADVYNHCVRKISVDGEVSTLAGSTAGYRNGVGTEAQFHTVQSICVDALDNIYVADWDNICIRKITPDGTVTLFAGRPGVRGAYDGPLLEATFETPDQMAFAPNGNMFLTDWVNGLVRVIDTNGMVSTFAGGLTYAHRILVDAESNVYATWGVPGPVTFMRKFRPDASIAWTVGGYDHVGFEDGPIATAKFTYAFSPVLRPNGDILISDQINHRIRLITMGVPALLSIHGPSSYYRSAVVRIETLSATADVRYTLDESDPHEASPRYTGPFTINAPSTTVKARLFVGSTPVSEIVSATFTRLDTPGAPVIIYEPYDQTVDVGGTAYFQVYAHEEPLTYQWLFESEPLTGANSALLQIVNVQPADAGNYSVIVSNPIGSVTSRLARLTVTLPPTLLRVQGTVVDGGSTFSLSVAWKALGTEHAVGFSLACNPSLITFLDVALADEAPAAASLVFNSNEFASGRAGVLVSMPTGDPFPAGDYPLIVVQCRAYPASAWTPAAVWFTDGPTTREVSDVDAQSLPALYYDGGVEILPIPPLPLEGDAAPRFNGDYACTVIDWVQVGRFVTGLDTVQPGEFARVDCAPRDVLGNGILSVSDWVQAGRYAAGLDPLTAAGGPTEAAGPAAFVEGTSQSLIGSTRNLVIPDAELGYVSSFTLPVELDAQGGENAVGFSVAFDPARLALISVGKGASTAGATLNANVTFQSSGRAGVALALPAGNALTPGRHEIARLHWTLLDPSAGVATVSVTQSPVLSEVADVQAQTLSCDFTGGTISYQGAVKGPRLGLSRSEGDVVLFWPSIHAGYELQSASSVNGTWTSTGASPIRIGDQFLVIVSTEKAPRYYRLHKPL